MANSSHRHRTVHGIALTGQAVGLLLAAAGVMVLIALAILSWLEHMQ
ncbi:MAG: hypothetical protein QOI82_2588 [Actinomycetota bacterium]|nr:hypothetical protein [Actinomycetota bacterium]